MRFAWPERSYELVEASFLVEAGRQADIPVCRANVELFMTFVDRSGDCWTWTGRRFPAGYGIFCADGPRTEGKWVYAHRFSLSIHAGPLGELLACHRCDNPPCVRPDHLFAGTHSDNTQDAIAKGRWGDRRYLGGHPKRVTIDGSTRTIGEWLGLIGITYTSYRYRIVRLGWSEEKALTTPRTQVGGAVRKAAA